MMKDGGTMTDHADLIAEAREFAGWFPPSEEQAADLMRRLAAALESQPAPLVADSREALAQIIIDAAWGGADPHEIADALIASGVVSLAADRDRATAERAWDEGNKAGWDENDFGDTRNPYRESEARND